MNFNIRRVEPDDYQSVRRIFDCPSVIGNTLQLPYPSAEMWRKRVANERDGRHTLVATEANDQSNLIGYLGLDVTTRPRRNHVGEVGIMVADGWQGKGVGTALMEAAIDLADNWLNLLRLELTVFIDNDAAIALYERFGFDKEGVHRMYAFRNGEYVDSLAMARLRPQK